MPVWREPRAAVRHYLVRERALELQGLVHRRPESNAAFL